MKLPIYAWGQPVLKKKAAEVSEDMEGLEELLTNMWETMYNAQGVGLAGPQVGVAKRIFLIDTIQVMDEDKMDEGIKQVFINAEMVDEYGEPWTYEEGCLSIPQIRGDVERLGDIRIRFQDENFKEFEKVFTGINARVIQHEYDHIEGKLFTEMLKPIKKRRIKRKLEEIKKGNVAVEYKMKFVRTK